LSVSFKEQKIYLLTYEDCWFLASVLEKIVEYMAYPPVYVDGLKVDQNVQNPNISGEHVDGNNLVQLEMYVA